MQHRHLNTSEWTLMAIDSLFERGTLPDWKEFAAALKADPALANRTLSVCNRHEDRPSVTLARLLLARYHPNIH